MLERRAMRNASPTALRSCSAPHLRPRPCGPSHRLAGSRRGYGGCGAAAGVDRRLRRRAPAVTAASAGPGRRARRPPPGPARAGRRRVRRRPSGRRWRGRAARGRGGPPATFGGAIDRLVAPRPVEHQRQQRVAGRPRRRRRSGGRRTARPRTRSRSGPARPAATGPAASASSPRSRSAARVYCARSLVPMLPKSTSARTWRARSAAAGTSIITPTEGRPFSRTRRANHAASSAVATMGAMTRTSAPVARAALASAASWVSSRSGRRADRRSPRRPRAGLPSGPRSANASGLSAPASSVRTTTQRSPNGSNTWR